MDDTPRPARLPYSLSQVKSHYKIGIIDTELGLNLARSSNLVCLLAMYIWVHHTNTRFRVYSCSICEHSERMVTSWLL